MMEKQTFQSVQLVCTMQQETTFTGDQCYRGILSKKQHEFRFEETMTSKPHHRNPKLFDGQYLSLVHKQNGKYQCHLKTITVSDGFDSRTLAGKVYDELLNALKIID